MKLHDSPLKSGAEEENAMSKLDPSQKRKLRQKQRKAEARAKKVKLYTSLLSHLLYCLLFCPIFILYNL